LEVKMIQKFPWVPRPPHQAQALGLCEHRAVSKDGKIVTGDDEVSPNLCRTCPLKAVNCAHLCFSLRQTSPSPLVVRFNGRTEVWDDDPPEIRFEQAACALKVMPIAHPRQCVGCALRQPVQAAGEPPSRQERRVVKGGLVVPFPSREVAAATG
jgi:hypothetical protein